MDSRILEQVILDQRTAFAARPCGVQRHIDLEGHLQHDRVVVITGLRRVGKSTLLRQIAERVGDYHYADLDDERLTGFGVTDFQAMLEAWHKRSAARVILLDEVQEVPGWERFVRRVNDGGYKVFLTGSNAKLLSAELGTHLTGRHSRVELFPFSFREVLDLKGIDAPAAMTTDQVAKVRAEFDSYLMAGGMPEHVQFPSRDYLQQVYEDVLHRDILVRKGIRRVGAFKALAHYLYSNFTADISYNRLAQVLEYKAATSVASAVSHLEEAYLAFEVLKYDHSMRKQHVNEKKIYVIDNGIRTAVAFQFSPDLGKYLENLVFVSLKRQGKRIYFSRDRSECDFLVVDGKEVTEAIQVCHSLNAANSARELGGLADVLTRHPEASPLLLTAAETRSFPLARAGRDVQVLPVWRWLLGI